MAGPSGIATGRPAASLMTPRRSERAHIERLGEALRDVGRGSSGSGYRIEDFGIVNLDEVHDEAPQPADENLTIENSDRQHGQEVDQRQAPEDLPTPK